jgi:hypothetical protein
VADCSSRHCHPMANSLGAMSRVPFRSRWHGSSYLSRNIVVSVTRELVRSFLGYASSLPIDEFRALEAVLDDVASRILTPLTGLRESGDCDRHLRWSARHLGFPFSARKRCGRRQPRRWGVHNSLSSLRRLHRRLASNVFHIHGAPCKGDGMLCVRGRLSACARVPVSRCR